MLIIDNRTLNHLADKLVPRIAERLAARPRPGDIAGDPEGLLSQAAAAAILGLRPAKLCTWRSRGRGPAFLKIGRKRRAAVRYKRGVILAYRDARESNPEKSA